MPPRGYGPSLLPPAQRATRENELPRPEFTQAEEKRNSATSKMKNITYVYKYLNISNEYLFIYMATRPRF
jgi:hypothetical protein